MISRKNRPVLYEVIRKRRAASTSWLPSARSAPREPAPADLPRSPSPSPPRTPPAAEPAADALGLSRFDMRNGRVRIQLSYPAAAVAAAVLLVLLIVSFAIGRRTGAPAPLTDTFKLDEGSFVEAGPTGSSSTTDGAVSLPPRSEALRDSENRTGAAQDGKTEIARDGAKDARGGAPKVQLQPGMSYIQIQAFPKKDEADLNKAATFLAENGVPCCKVTRKADFVLYASQPFNLSQKDTTAKKREQQAADTLVKRIKDLGSQYAKAGKGYRFEWAKPEEMR